MGIIPPWSDLPTELLTTISNFLISNPLDILSFRCVCKSWSSSSSSSFNHSPPKLFPLLPLTLSPPPHILGNRYCYSSLNIPFNILSITRVYFLRPPSEYDEITTSGDADNPKGWILFVDQSNPGKVTIRKPFSNASYSLPINFPKTLDLLSFRATEIARFYNISRCVDKDGNFTRLSLWSGVVRKVVLHSGFDCGYVVVVVLSDEGKLGLLRLGLRDGDISNEGGLGTAAEWEVIHDGKGFRFDDIVDFKGKMLGIDRRGRVYKVEIGGGSSPVVISAVVPPITGGGGKRKRLVESLGCLYLVVRSNLREETDPMFKVYELRDGAKKWAEVNSLGGRTFFLGLDFSFSASAEELHGSCGKNCVVYKERSFLNYSGYDDDSDLFRKLKSCSLNLGVWSLDDAAKLDVIGSLPGYSKVLWPPPCWFWKNEMSVRVETLLTALYQLQIKIPHYEKLEAKLGELSPWKQNCALTIIKSGIKMKGTLDQAKEIDKLLKEIQEVSLLWLKHYDINLRNQGGSTTVESKEQCQSMLEKDIKQVNDVGKLLSMKMKLHTVVLTLEENTSELEDVVNTRKFSASIGELTEILESK